jgi:hypothetical protein
MVFTVNKRQELPHVASITLNRFNRMHSISPEKENPLLRIGLWEKHLRIFRVFQAMIPCVFTRKKIRWHDINDIILLLL